MKMRAVGVSMNMLMMAVAESNLNVGSKTIEENGMEFVIRGTGLIRNVEDLRKIVLAEGGRAPVRLSDVARVEIGGDFRRSTLDVNGREVVGGTVVMRTGANAREVIARVRDRVASLSASLPPGITIRSFYDRGEWIDRTLATLKRALLEEIGLVIVAHIVFLSHFRSIFIVTLPLPMSILISFIGMRHFGIASNVMSLYGIAIAIGVIVDGAIVITENVIRHCDLAERRKGVALTASERFVCVMDASQGIGRPIVFAMAIIIFAFAPVFALGAQEGILFHPLAFAKTFMMAGSTVLAVTLVPVLCTLLVRGPYLSEERNIVCGSCCGSTIPSSTFP